MTEKVNYPLLSSVSLLYSEYNNTNDPKSLWALTEPTHVKWWGQCLAHIKDLMYITHNQLFPFTFFLQFLNKRVTHPIWSPYWISSVRDEVVYSINANVPGKQYTRRQEVQYTCWIIHCTHSLNYSSIFVNFFFFFAASWDTWHVGSWFSPSVLVDQVLISRAQAKLWRLQFLQIRDCGLVVATEILVGDENWVCQPRMGQSGKIEWRMEVKSGSVEARKHPWRILPSAAAVSISQFQD